MALYLGYDTSNYTTSAAVYDETSQSVSSSKRLLPVAPGQLGLKQSDAVFAHIKQLPTVTRELFSRAANHNTCEAVGDSARPRDVEGSYMPCFLVGECAAKTYGDAAGVPVYAFSHQAGHLAAALYSVKRLELVNERFLAFHVSGGTTECLLVEPSQETIVSATIVAQSLDLKAGQAVDRVGVMLGLAFPAGRYLDELARASTKRYKIKPSMKDGDCSLSGIENRCREQFLRGDPHCDIALYCIEAIRASLACMTERVCGQYSNLPLLYTGGVMSNSLIREDFTRRYGGLFAAAEYSSDNAAGTAILSFLKHHCRV